MVLKSIFSYSHSHINVDAHEATLQVVCLLLMGKGDRSRMMGKEVLLTPEGLKKLEGELEP